MRLLNKKIDKLKKHNEQLNKAKCKIENEQIEMKKSVKKMKDQALDHDINLSHCFNKIQMLQDHSNKFEIDSKSLEGQLLRVD